ADWRRRKERTDLVAGHDLDRFGPQLGCEVDEIVRAHPLQIVRPWPCDERLRRRVPLPGHGALRYRTLLDWPHRLTGHAVEYVEPALLRWCGDGLDQTSVDRDVGKDRR